MKSWIGVDLDGTLAKYQGFQGIDHIGEPVIPILNLVKKLISEGNTVKIFTSRIDGGVAGNWDSHFFSDVEAVRKPIVEWCKNHIGMELEITNVKDGAIALLLDDKCRQVELNTGRIAAHFAELTF